MHNISIFNRTKAKIDTKYYLEFSSKIIDQISLKKSISFSVSFVAPKESQKLNNRYRKKNKPTNILTFKVGDITENENPAELGDIFLCSDIIKKEESSLNQKNRTEHLIVHGILHLLNYSHDNEKSAIIMERKEKELLNSF